MRQFFWKYMAKLLARPGIANALISYALKHPYMHLPSNEDPSYMGRYWVFNRYDRTTNKPKYFFWPWSVRIHHIKRADYERDLHDHPWNARTVILKGWYRETRLGLIPQFDGQYYVEASVHHTRLPGDTAELGFGEYHSITEVDPDGVWTLFISGPWRGVWGFLVDGVKIPWKKYLGIPEKGDLGEAYASKSLVNRTPSSPPYRNPPPPVVAGYSAVASVVDTAWQIPKLGSKWRHRNGVEYMVQMITNEDSTRPEYPTTVVYVTILNGKRWSRPLSEWYRSMTEVTFDAYQ